VGHRGEIRPDGPSGEIDAGTESEGQLALRRAKRRMGRQFGEADLGRRAWGRVRSSSQAASVVVEGEESSAAKAPRKRTQRTSAKASSAPALHAVSDAPAGAESAAVTQPASMESRR
jgi:hypothetical protein